MSAPRKHLVFVYGTLKRSGSNHSVISRQTYCGEARTTKGFKLVHLGDYPGMIRDPANELGVAGEVWSVDDACLAELDRLESLAEGLYRREHVALLPPFADQNIETYFYARNTEGRSSISNGVWTEPR